MQKFVTIGENELYVNFLDVDFKGKYNTEIERFSENLQNIDENLTDELESMRLMAGYSKVFFDSVWGEGTFDKIFEGRKDLDEIFRTLNAISEMQDSQEAAFETMCTEISAKANDDEHLA